MERNRRKCGTRGATAHIYRVLFMADSLSLIWGHSMHFAKSPILRFSKHYSSPNFHPILSKIYSRHHIHGAIQAITFLAICQKLKKLWHFEIFVNTGPYGAGNFNVLFLPRFSLEPIQTYKILGYHGKSKCLLEC